MTGFENYILKHSRAIITFFGFVFIVAFIVLISVIINKSNIKKANTENQSINAQITPPATEEKVLSGSSKSEIEWNIGNRLPNTSENIEIKAININKGDFIAILRFRIEGGEIVDIKTPYTLIEGCAGEKDKQIACIDIAKDSPFTEGEVIATVNVKWAEGPSLKIFKSAEYGYYNGSVFTSGK